MLKMLSTSVQDSPHSLEASAHVPAAAQLDAATVTALLREGLGEQAAQLGDGDWRELSAVSMGFSGSRVATIELLGDGGGGCAPRHLVLKATARTVGAGAKVQRVRRSHTNECGFLRAHAVALAAPPTACPIPRPLLARTARPGGAGGSGERALGHAVLMEALRAPAWEQHALLPTPLVGAALGWLARFHAHFAALAGAARTGGGGTAWMWEQMWEQGMDPGRRADAAQLRALPAALERFAASCAADPAAGRAALYFGDAVRARRLGERLRDASEHISARLLAASRTVVHGDFKQANLFFETGVAAAQRLGAKQAHQRAADPTRLVAAIDFQWTGPGCGATDLAYLCGCALPDEAVADWEARVLRPYHGELLAALRQPLARVTAPPPFEQLLLEFKLAHLDWFRWVGAAVLPGLAPASMRALAQSGDINRGQYAKDLGRMEWAWRRAEEFLDELYPVMEAGGGAAGGQPGRGGTLSTTSVAVLTTVAPVVPAAAVTFPALRKA